MDLETIKTLVMAVNTVFIPVVVFLYYRTETALNKSDSVKTELHAYQLKVAEEYVTKEDLKDHLERIEKTLDEVKTLLSSR